MCARRPAGSARFAAALAAALALSAGPWAARGPAFAQAQPAERVFELRIEGGKLAQGDRAIRVQQGDAVRLRWRSSAPVDLHLHGYDIELHIEPGAAAEMAFVARATGRFTVEVHGTRTPAGGHRHGPALVTVEVYPK